MCAWNSISSTAGNTRHRASHRRRVRLPAGKIYLPATSKYFTVTCALTATTYTVTATGNAAQGMGGFVYTVDQGNNRKTTGLPSGWSGAGASSTCWINRKSGDC